MKKENPSDLPAFELKGSVLTVMVLHLRDTRPELLYKQLAKKIGQGRAFFASAPVLVDLSGIDEERQAGLDCGGLAGELRQLGLVPVAVRGAALFLHEQILQAGLGVLPAIKGEKVVDLPEAPRKRVADEESIESPSEPVKTAESKVPDATAVTPERAAKTLVVRLPIRSGQQVLAPTGDVIVLSSVNAGGEVLAGGNIHVYGALRGRAMAGIHGDTTARIFSLQCNAELVAVAGEYVVNEMLAKDVVNRSVIISRGEDGLQFTPLG